MSKTIAAYTAEPTTAGPNAAAHRARVRKDTAKTKLSRREREVDTRYGPQEGERACVPALWRRRRREADLALVERGEAADIYDHVPDLEEPEPHHQGPLQEVHSLCSKYSLIL